ncbi:MAG: hypothetical protein WAK17_21225, partial [Candidatus Nitrosopolaris sp.]
EIVFAISILYLSRSTKGGLYFGLGFANFESNSPPKDQVSPKRPSKIFPKNFIESLLKLSGTTTSTTCSSEYSSRKLILAAVLKDM